jgi:hypothetical protein
MRATGEGPPIRARVHALCACRNTRPHTHTTRPPRPPTHPPTTSGGVQGGAGALAVRLPARDAGAQGRRRAGAARCCCALAACSGARPGARGPRRHRDGQQQQRRHARRRGDSAASKANTHARTHFNQHTHTSTSACTAHPHTHTHACHSSRARAAPVPATCTRCCACWRSGSCSKSCLGSRACFRPTSPRASSCRFCVFVFLCACGCRCARHACPMCCPLQVQGCVLSLSLQPHELAKPRTAGCAAIRTLRHPAWATWRTTSSTCPSGRPGRCCQRCGAGRGRAGQGCVCVCSCVCSCVCVP